MSGFIGKFPGVDSATEKNQTILLDGDSGNITLGGAGIGGDIHITSADKKTSIWIKGGEVVQQSTETGISDRIPSWIRDFAPHTILLDGPNGSVVLGSEGKNGQVSIVNGVNQLMVKIDIGGISINEPGVNGLGVNERINIKGNGTITVYDKHGIAVINLQADGGILLDSPGGNIRLGGSENAIDGEVFVFSKNKSRTIAANASIQLNGSDGNLYVGGSESGTSGQLSMFPKDKSRASKNNASIQLDGLNGSITTQGNMTSGDITSKGSITSKGNLIHQSITERSKQIYENQVINLFSIKQDGFFIVELACSYRAQIGDVNPDYTTSWMYTRTNIFTANIPDLSQAVQMTQENNYGGAMIPNPTLTVQGDFLTLSLGKFNNTYPTTGNITVSVKSLYGTLLDF